MTHDMLYLGFALGIIFQFGWHTMWYRRSEL